MLVIRVLHILHLAIVSYFACVNLIYMWTEQIIAYQEKQKVFYIVYHIVTEVSVYWAWALWCCFETCH